MRFNTDQPIPPKRDEMSLDIVGLDEAAKRLIARYGRDMAGRFAIAIRRQLDAAEPRTTDTGGPLLPKMPLPPHLTKKS